MEICNSNYMQSETGDVNCQDMARDVLPTDKITLQRGAEQK
jgi:hypothetical protein